MSRYHVLLSAFVFCVALPVAQAEPYCGEGYGAGVMASLSPEQRMMHYAEVQEAVANLSPNDMRSFRSDVRNRVLAMMPRERKDFMDGLSAKWKALAPAQRAKIQQSFTTYRNDGMWAGLRQGKSGGGCWW